jgi:hypothetical protein
LILQHLPILHESIVSNSQIGKFPLSNLSFVSVMTLSKVDHRRYFFRFPELNWKS